MRTEKNNFFDRFLLPVLALILGLSVALALAAISGENPLEVLMILLRGSLGSATQIGYSLFYATPLIFTGISVAWAFKSGLFNIGAEGQMAIGGLAMAVVGICFPTMPSLVAIPLALFAAFFAGGMWGAIAGWMKAKRGCHEVLATILLNFVAYGLVGFFILSVFNNQESASPETMAIGASYQLSEMTWLGGTSPLSTAFFYAVVALAIYGFVFKKTLWGFRQRLTGGAPGVALRAGVNLDREIIKAMFMAGGFAGLAGLGLVLGFAHKAREGFTSGLGFVGIAVALLGRNSAIGIFLAALLFGVLTKGALDLDIDTESVTRDLAVVIQALIVIAIASHQGLHDLFLRWRKVSSVEEKPVVSAKVGPSA